jgi:hypothetical protein
MPQIVICTFSRVWVSQFALISVNFVSSHGCCCQLILSVALSCFIANKCGSPHKPTRHDLLTPSQGTTAGCTSRVIIHISLTAAPAAPSPALKSKVALHCIELIELSDRTEAARSTRSTRVADEQCQYPPRCRIRLSGYRSWTTTTIAFPLPVVAQMQASFRLVLPPPRLSVAPLRLPIPRGCDKRGWYSHRIRSASCRQLQAPRFRTGQIPMWRHTCPCVRLWRPLPPPRNRYGLIQIFRPTRPALTVAALLLISLHVRRRPLRRPPRLPRRRSHRPRHRRCVTAASRRACGKCSATVRIRAASSSDAHALLPMPALPPRHPRRINLRLNDAISSRGPTTRRTPRALRKCGGGSARPRGIASSAPEGRYGARVRWVDNRWVDNRDRQEASEFINIHFHCTNTSSNPRFGRQS